MQESILHFIWQFQKFERSDLQTPTGDNIVVFETGHYNTDSGPDFGNARVLIDEVTWAGHVEIHHRSSDWNRHGHETDHAYDNVILHVVWEHDQEVKTNNGVVLPTLELKNRVSFDLLRRCQELTMNPLEIPCETRMPKVKSIQRCATLESVLVERLNQKASIILNMLANHRGSWEETAYQLLGKYYGFKTNADAFHKLTQVIPHKILVKHRKSLLHLESLLYGVAGFLNDEVHKDDYSDNLKREFQFLSKKYGLTERQMLKVEWKFLRMRPGNFPTLRIAQFASFMHHNTRFFDRLINFQELSELRQMFGHELSGYWQRHYDFSKESKRINHGIGAASIDLLLINVVAPLIAAYAIKTKNEHYMSKATDLLYALKPEKNHITERWQHLGWKAESAFDSQGQIGLFRDFCLKKRCLSCKIGISLINSN